MVNEDKPTRTEFQIQLDNMSVNEILAFVNVLRIIQHTDKFKKWVQGRYPSVAFDPLYEGYQYLALSSFNCILDALLLDDLLNLKEDYTLRRVRHQGLKFDKVPNTCEKTIFIKRILTYTQKIKAAKNWQQLEDGLKDLDTLLSIFEEMTMAYCLDKTNLEDKRNKAAQLYVYDKLLDTREYGPRAMRVPIFDLNLQIPYLKRAFDGYVYCLEFIWFSLLGESEFGKMSVSKLHEAKSYPIVQEDDIGTADDWLTEEEMNAEFLKDEQPGALKKVRADPKLRKEKEEWVQGRRELRDWLRLESIYNKTDSEIIKKLEKEYNLENRFGPMFYMQKLPAGYLIGKIDKNELSEPKYLTPKSANEWQEFLNWKFLWYESCILNTDGLGGFAGGPSFAPMLVGLVTLADPEGDEDRVIVRVIKHPADVGEGKFDYSYAILVNNFGNLSDSSGWLVFYDIGTDYSGYGGSINAYAMAHIEAFKKRNKIEVEELIVDKGRFKKFLESTSIGPVFDKMIIHTPMGKAAGPSISEVINEYENRASLTRGKFFEYVYFKWLSHTKDKFSNKCDILLSREQIDDVSFSQTGEIAVYECKIDIHEKVQELVEQVNRKVNAIKTNHPQSKPVPYLIFYEGISLRRKAELEREGIVVEHNFKARILTDAVFDGSRKEILHILERKSL